ncbi:DUF1428 domain-containing protein [Parasphingopyxis marina]|uniref:DUF1428 domain-containing protein n=1 Tax=Parasphingopyxis marina TaxID=2761622 RepID=A0A842I0E0_9SPHN|nr:DUF1428 domain-containing protein [Parasphingopyxis marina]MBC2778595.1 DUF1428 domain-containing protein [Parasphingopyxis marina]
MTFIQGFLVPVPEGNKAAYREMAASAVPMFEKHGMQRMVECWGDYLPRGETTDMYGAVMAEEGETVVFSWVDWGSREGWEKAHKAFSEDETMEMPKEMPFDGMRMVFAEFETVVETGTSGAGAYVQGCVIPVPKANREAYAEMARSASAVFQDYGALYTFDGWAEDIADGKVVDFKHGVKAKADEAVVFSFIEWPDRATLEAAMAKMHEDERMPAPGAMPFEGKRMIFGGFEPILDTGKA